jgi:hypothetical protein
MAPNFINFIGIDAMDGPKPGTTGLAQVEESGLSPVRFRVDSGVVRGTARRLEFMACVRQMNHP